MSWKIKALLRGDAVAYAVADFSHIPVGARVEFSATLNGKLLPTGTYDAPELLTACNMTTGASRQGTDDLRLAPAEEGWVRLVASFPLVDALVILAPAVCYPDGRRVPLAAEKLTPLALKWGSRYEYRNRPHTGIVVRDLDKKLSERQIHANTIRILETADCQQLVIKGEIDAPAEANVKSFVIDRAGNPVDLDIWFGKPQTATVSGHDRTRIGFSLRIPTISYLSCIVFYCEDAYLARPAYFSLEQGYLFRAKERYEYDDPFYRVLRIDRYQAWVQSVANQGRHGYNLPDDGPTFSIIVPLYKTPRNFFREMYESVLYQSYEKWQLVLVNASPEDEGLAACLEEIDDPRVMIVPLESNGGISVNTNAGVRKATGDYICFFDHDDLLDLDILSEYAQVIAEKPDTDVLYCDEDLFRAEDGRQTPQLKSDFNIDLLRSCNFITHFLCVRSELAKTTPLRPEHDGAQDYDMVLRLSEKTRKFEHVPQVLYHWRVHANSTAQTADNKSYAIEAGRSALEAHMRRVGIPGHAENTPWSCFYRMVFDFPRKPLVSIVIPNKDGADYLRACVSSIQEKSTYRNFEIVIVENNSETTEIFDLYRELTETYDNVNVITWAHEFNYSKINNFGVEHTQGEYLILLNNDTEVIAPNWIEAMLGYCLREDVGAVGAKLLYPDDTIQHAGVMIMSPTSPTAVATPAHIYQHHEKEWPGINRRAQLPQDLMAVTAACMMVSRADYDRVGGFDPAFAVAYNDIDFCFKLRKAGLLVVYSPEAELYHLESVTRGADIDTASHKSNARFLSERGLMCALWSDVLCEVDPYFGRAAQIII